MVTEGSIPAGAGDGPPCSRCSRRPRVYPRWCGGRLRLQSEERRVMGLSPLVRGTVSRACLASWRVGSIPAGAGDGGSGAGAATSVGVYPRWCGGRMALLNPKRAEEGLSPLVRGTGGCGAGAGRCRGSIPAGAGDGRRGPRRPDSARVYPRWCGGRPVDGARQEIEQGLSPLVRGTATTAALTPTPAGSIPAGAGDGTRRCAASTSRGVYPRWCGGRLMPLPPEGLASGLSPLVRGTASTWLAASAV